MRAFDWVSSFGRGFKYGKPETYGQAFMPKYNRGGMMPAYGIHHEQWVRPWPALSVAHQLTLGSQ